MTSLKLCYRDDIRRVPSSVSENFRFDDLSALIKSYFGIEGPFSLKYTDDENDLITISNDADLAEAFRIAVMEERKTLRIHVNVGEKAQTLYPRCPIVGGASAPAHAFSDDVVTHRHVICDGCGMHPIRGVRFKCTVCPDFDLCAGCESAGTHGHPFLKIEKPRPLFSTFRGCGRTSNDKFAGNPDCKVSPIQLFEQFMNGQIAPEVAVKKGLNLMEQLGSADQSNKRAECFRQVISSFVPGFCGDKEWEHSDVDRAVAASMEQAFGLPSPDGERKEDDPASSEASEKAAAEKAAAEKAAAEKVAAEKAAAEKAAAEKAAAEKAAAEKAAAEKAAEEKAAAEKAAAEKAAAEKAAEEKAAADRALLMTKYAAQLKVLGKMGHNDLEKLLPLLEKHCGEMLPLFEEFYTK